MGAVMLVAVSAGRAGDEMKMTKPVEVPHAGIAMAVPTDYAVGALEEPFQVLRAVKVEDGKAAQAVTLSAFPVAADQSAVDFADDMIAELRQQLLLRDLKTINETSIKVAGLTGAGRFISYSHSGLESVAAGVCFVRKLEKGGGGLCYVLSIESPADRKGDVLPVLEEIIKTVSFRAIKAPSELATGELDEPLTVRQQGYSVRPPKGWFANVEEGGVVVMGQNDYTLGGEVMPMAKVVVQATPAEAQSSDWAKNSLKLARKHAAQMGAKVEVVKEGKATLGGKECYQFVLRQTAAPATKPAAPASAPADDESAEETAKKPKAKSAEEPSASDEAAPSDEAAATEQAVGPVYVVQRTLCLCPAGKDQGRSYNLILVCRGDKPDAAEALMDKLAGGFKLIDSQPPSPPDEAEKPTRAGDDDAEESEDAAK